MNWNKYWECSNVLVKAFYLTWVCLSLTIPLVLVIFKINSTVLTRSPCWSEVRIVSGSPSLTFRNLCLSAQVQSRSLQKHYKVYQYLNACTYNHWLWLEVPFSEHLCDPWDSPYLGQSNSTHNTYWLIHFIQQATQKHSVCGAGKVWEHRQPPDLHSLHKQLSPLVGLFSLAAHLLLYLYSGLFNLCRITLANSYGLVRGIVHRTDPHNVPPYVNWFFQELILAQSSRIS